MSFAATNWVLDALQADDRLQPSARLVALVLADRASKSTGEAYVSARWVGSVTGLSRSSIWRATVDLAAAGVLTVERRPGTAPRVRFPVVDAVRPASTGPCSPCDGTGWVPVAGAVHTSAPCPDCRPAGGAVRAG